MILSFTFTEEAVALLGDGLHEFYPERASSGAAAFDLRALKKSYLYPGDITMIQTGIRVAIREGFFGMVVSRSGKVFNQGLAVANSPGIIDSDYRGEICVLLHRHTFGGIPDETDIHWIDQGERIAQLLIMKHNTERAMHFSPEAFAKAYDNTARGHGGFGSTGG